MEIMEIEAHEFEAFPFNSQRCNECNQTKNAPVHIDYATALGINNKPMWVDVPAKTRINPESCKHQSFECSGPAAGGRYIRHKCNDCDWCWTNAITPSAFVHCDICMPPTKFVTKDSGQRTEYASGMQRDTQDDKPRFDLLFPIGVPYSDQFLTRVAELLARGAVKYEERNWEKAEGEAELNRFRSSANRHMIQWLCGETDEDHMAAVVFNLMGAHLVEWKMNHD